MLLATRAAPAVASSVEELAQRRAAAMRLLPDGLLLLHARSEAKAEDQPGFQQDASFQYFTGMQQIPGAILVLDGPRQEARLFVGPPPQSFGQSVAGLGPQPDASDRLGFDAITSWTGFVAWLRTRLADGNPVLYVDAPRRPESSGNPPGLAPVAGPMTLWRGALATAFPGATIQSALPALRRLRWVKSATEIATLRANARATAAALRVVARRIAPGVRQRQTEATVISGCVAAGAQGPSFWPWTMSGPNTHLEQLVRAFYSYRHLDRTMQSGELVRVDIGCRGGGYGADVGRTLPVSGHFDELQRELWDLLVDGYLAGLDAVRDGVPVARVRAASRARIRASAPTLRFAAARAAAAALDDDAAWHLHGVGIESGEEALPILRQGTVLAYEPMLVAGDDVMYLEDMILVTSGGHEVLSAGLPYHAADVEALMNGRH